MVMATSLRDQLDAKVKEISNLVSNVSDDQAARAPAQGEWCVKEVLSHLAGDDGRESLRRLQRFVQEDTPSVDLTPGLTHGDQHQGKSAQQLLAEVEGQYSEIARFVGGLSDGQLSRKAHIPMLKESPLGEYPTLGQWTGFLINYHLAGHIAQLQKLCQ